MEIVAGPARPEFAALNAESKDAPFHEDRQPLLIAWPLRALAQASAGIERQSVTLLPNFESA